MKKERERESQREKEEEREPRSSIGRKEETPFAPPPSRQLSLLRRRRKRERESRSRWDDGQEAGTIASKWKRVRGIQVVCVRMEDRRKYLKKSL